jgi:hypothetical protein
VVRNSVGFRIHHGTPQRTAPRPASIGASWGCGAELRIGSLGRAQLDRAAPEMPDRATTPTALDRFSALHPLVLAGLCTLADACAGLLHWLNEEGVLSGRFFRLSRDRGFGEIIQYAKFGLILWLLVTWHKATPARVLRAWIVLFAILLLDDSIGIHEWVGGLLVSDTGQRGPFGVRMKDLAEVVPLIVLEGSALAYVGLEYLRAEPLLQRVSRAIGLALVPYVASSLFLDLARWPLAEQIGEMASMTVLLLVVHALFRAHGPLVRSVDPNVSETSAPAARG